MLRTLLSFFKNENVKPYESVDPFTNSTYNYPNTAIDPSTDAGMKFAQSLGGMDNIKQTYDHINRLANDNTKTNIQRSDAVKKAYNVDLKPATIKLRPGEPQVFPVGPGYQYTFQEAPAVCAKYGAKVATTAQLEEAQRNGADWCFSGWVTEGQGKWPINLTPIPGCGERTGIIEWTPGDRAGVNCYGPKPDMNEPGVQNTIGPFNQQMWSKPPPSDTPTYLTIPSGYLETNGPQPSCFGGLSPEQAQQQCNALGAACVGFSYSKNGNGGGCYKGNHNAGIQPNPAYMGYVKINSSPLNAVVTGRYIKLQYSRVDWLNLVQIFVYSTKNGPNIITPNTSVTGSSEWGGYPMSNIVNGKHAALYNIAHSGRYEVPWLIVDLGSSVPIYKIIIINRRDCCRERILGTTLSILDEVNTPVYISNPVTTTNIIYTWFPPNSDVKPDQPDDIGLTTPEGPWKCLPGINVPLKKNAQGDVQCMSHDGVGCLWRGSEGECNALIANVPEASIRPLVCGEMHARHYGGGGYDNPGHWCARARNTL